MEPFDCVKDLCLVPQGAKLALQLKTLKQRAQDFDVGDGLATFIQTWLIDHVNHFDREFVGHFLKAGVDPLAAPKAAPKS